MLYYIKPSLLKFHQTVFNNNETIDNKNNYCRCLRVNVYIFINFNAMLANKQNLNTLTYVSDNRCQTNT